MRIRQLKIAGFRGIRALDWRPNSKLCCLIGPGDSGKSTILDAIELALSPRQEVPLSDLDIWNLEGVADVSIDITFSGFPEYLKDEHRFGLLLRGWNEESGSENEPEDPLERVLKLRFRFDQRLEPRWEIVGLTSVKEIYSSDRASLGVTRLGADPGRHLAWTRGSALMWLARTIDATAANEDPRGQQAVRTAVRELRGSLRKTPLPALEEGARTVMESARSLGLSGEVQLKPGLNPASLSFRQGPFSLHDSQIPLAMTGLGTQRLAAMGAQRTVVGGGAVLLIDEIEVGLEPYRVRNLIRAFRSDQVADQVLLTTHSPAALEEAHAPELCVVRRSAEGVSVANPSADLQAIIRSTSEAFLSPRLVVCEGKTEMFLVRGLEPWLGSTEAGATLASSGVTTVDGRGEEKVKRALAFAGLGYKVALFSDSDKALAAGVIAELSSRGVELIAWAPGKHTELQISSDLPWGGFEELVKVAVDLAPGLLDAFAHCWGEPLFRSPDPASWASKFGEESARARFGGILHERDVFKPDNRGESLAKVILPHLRAIPDSGLVATLGRLRDWIRGASAGTTG